jgi:menaquinone-dependent protoporphyrinogen IX oxidase
MAKKTRYSTAGSTAEIANKINIILRRQRGFFDVFAIESTLVNLIKYDFGSIGSGIYFVKHLA